MRYLFSYSIFKNAILFLIRKPGSCLFYGRRVPVRKLNHVQFTDKGVMVGLEEFNLPNTMALSLSKDIESLVRKVA